MRFSTLIKVLQTGDAGLRWSQPGFDPWLEGAASLEQASAAQLSFLEKGNALTAALGASGVGALLLPDQQDLICLLYTSPSPRDTMSSRMPSSA